MTKREANILRQKARKFRRIYAGHVRWIRLNYHKCGTSQKPSDLGDEGWMEAHRRGGLAEAFIEAARQLEYTIKRLESEQGRKK